MVGIVLWGRGDGDRGEGLGAYRADSFQGGQVFEGGFGGGCGEGGAGDGFDGWGWVAGYEGEEGGAEGAVFPRGRVRSVN